MGHLSNPVGLRLGYTRFWRPKGNSAYMFTFLSNLMKNIFARRRFQRGGFIYSHAIVRHSLSKHFTVDVFFYDAHFELIFAEFLYYGYGAKRKKILTRFGERLCRNLFLKYGRQLLLDLVFNRLNKLFVWQVTKIPNTLSFNFIPIDNSRLNAVTLAHFSIRKLKSVNPLNDILSLHYVVLNLILLVYMFFVLVALREDRGLLPLYINLVLSHVILFQPMLITNLLQSL